MAETTNYQLFVTDDDTTLFKDWREQINGTTNSNMTKIDAALFAKAAKSEPVQIILAAADWYGDVVPYTQNITVDGMSADKNGIAAVSQTATTEQMTAAENAKLRVTGQSEDVVTISCFGEKPGVNIPVSIILLD